MRAGIRTINPQQLKYEDKSDIKFKHSVFMRNVNRVKAATAYPQTNLNAKISSQQPQQPQYAATFSGSTKTDNDVLVSGCSEGCRRRASVHQQHELCNSYANRGTGVTEEISEALC